MTTPEAPDAMDKVITRLADAWDRDPHLDGREIRDAWQILGPDLKALPATTQEIPTLGADAVASRAEMLYRRMGGRSRGRRHDLDAVLNAILSALKRGRFLDSPYRNHPVKIPRDTVLALDAIEPGLVSDVACFRTSLGGSAVLTAPSGVDPGTWAFGVWLAALVLDTVLIEPHLFRRVRDLTTEGVRPAGWIRIEAWRFVCRQRANVAEIVLPMQPDTRRAADLARRITAPSPQPGAPRPQLRVLPDAWMARGWRRTFWSVTWRALVDRARASPIFARGLSRLLTYGRLLGLLRGVPPFLIPIAAGELQVQPMTLVSHYRMMHGPSARQLRPPEAVPPPARRRGTRPRPVADGPAMERFTSIEAIRVQLRRRVKCAKQNREATKRTRRWAIGELSVLAGDTPFARTNEDPASANARVYGGWCIDLLRRRKSSISTMLSRSAAIAAVFPLGQFRSKAIWDWEAEDYLAVVAHGMAHHKTDYLVRAFEDLRDCLNRAELRTPTIPWERLAHQPVLEIEAVPLIGFDDFERGQRACRTLNVPAGMQELLGVMLVLGFWCGLRASEAASLTLAEYIGKPYYVLEIRGSKTFASTRDLLLSCLVPQEYLDLLDAWHSRRLQETGGNLKAPFLGRRRPIRKERDHPLGFYDSGYLAGLASKALRCAVGEALSFQDARHACASWLLLRLLAANRQIKVESMPWAAPIAFGAAALARITPLLYGGRTFSTAEAGDQGDRAAPQAIVPREGRRECSHLAMVLARLMGHAGPDTTLSSYCRTTGLAHGLILEQGWEGPFSSGKR